MVSFRGAMSGFCSHPQYQHGCYWEYFTFFLYCGLVVEIQIHFTATMCFFLLPFQRQPRQQGFSRNFFSEAPAQPQPSQKRAPAAEEAWAGGQWGVRCPWVATGSIHHCNVLEFSVPRPGPPVISAILQPFLVGRIPLLK